MNVDNPSARSFLTRRSARQLRALVAAVAVACSALVMVIPGSAAAVETTIVVNATGDLSDASGGTGACETSSGFCSLRAAIDTANALTNQKVTIAFAISGTGVKTIEIDSALPALNNGTSTAAGITIDGFTQSGATPNTSAAVDNANRLIEVVGSGAGVHNGFGITGRNNVIRGLVINEMNIAIRILGLNSTNSGEGNNNRVVGNMIGLEPDGSLVADYAYNNGSPCVSLVMGAGFNRIGTPALEDRNTISGCYEKGIYMENSNTFGNRIQNNIIGMDPTVTQRRSNQFGIDINGGVKNTIIGVEDDNALGANVLSGNRNSAIEISHDPSTTGNDIIGNFVGTDFSGDVATSQMVTNDYAIRLEGRRDANVNSCDEDSGMSVVSGNVIVGAGRGGILVDKGFISSTIRDNRIGVTDDGDVVGNGGFAVRIVSSSNNIIVRDNDIAGGSSGIQVGPRSVDPASTRDCRTDFNTFTDNRITDVTNNGIDLFPYGTASETTIPSPFVNEGIDRPEIFPQVGPIDVLTCAGCTIEVFATTRAAGLNGLAESGILRSGTAGPDGAVTLVQPTGGWPTRITATATTPNGSTSEFALAVVATNAVEPDELTVSTVEPSTAASGGSSTIIVNGEGFQQVVAVTVLGSADGVSVLSARRLDGSRLEVVLDVASDARIGQRTLSVVNGDGGTVATTITIVEGVPVAVIDGPADTPTQQADRIGNRVSTP